MIAGIWTPADLLFGGACVLIAALVLFRPTKGGGDQ